MHFIKHTPSSNARGCLLKAATALCPEMQWSVGVVIQKFHANILRGLDFPTDLNESTGHQIWTLRVGCIPWCTIHLVSSPDSSRVFIYIVTLCFVNAVGDYVFLTPPWQYSGAVRKDYVGVCSSAELCSDRTDLVLSVRMRTCLVPHRLSVFSVTWMSSFSIFSVFFHCIWF